MIKEPVTKEVLVEKVNEEFASSMMLAKPILENNLFKFNRFILEVEKGKGNVPLAPVHQEMCDFIDRNKRRKKIALIPRNHLKSTVITVGRSLQAIVKDPSVRILIANATYSNACSFLTEIKRHLKFNEKIHMMWGDLSLNAQKWSENSITLSQSKKKEPTVTAMGVESNLTSQHYDIIILDDVVNKDLVNTPEQIQKTISFYKECLNLLEPDGEVIVVGTRWHDSDLYGWILDKENKVFNDFDIFIKQAYEGNLFSDEEGACKLLFPAKHGQRHLRKLYESQGPYVFSCNPGEAPILMSDWSTKPISEIEVGNEIIGFNRGTSKEKTKLVSTKVKEVNSRVALVQRVELESGRVIRCTPDHNWYTGRFDKSHEMYLPAKIGRSLIEVINTDEKKLTLEQRLGFSYLGGMIDGEGSCKYGSVFIHQSQDKNKEVFSRIKNILNNLEFDYGEAQDTFWINGGRQSKFDILRYANPAKRFQVVNTLMNHSSRWGTEDRVVSITPDTKEKVYALTTETGNYVVWGYASKNCQYMNDPVPEENADFKKDWFKYYEPQDVKGRLMNKFTMIDPAISTEKTADYTAIVTIGIDELGFIYILDIFRERVGTAKLIEEVFRIWMIYRPLVMGIEDVAFQRSLQYTLSEEMRKRNTYINIKPLRPGGRNKDQRIRGLQPLYANGRVLHNKLLTTNVYLEDELLRFPRTRHDDVIDALSYMIDIPIYQPKRRKTFNNKKRYLYA